MQRCRGGPTTAAVGEYEIARGEFLVVHDDLDLPVGKLRFKRNGSSGGHRGIEDLIRHVGEGFQRLRFGIGRPVSQMPAEDYVLERLAATETGAIEAGVQRAVDGCLCWLSSGMQRAMNEFNADVATIERDQDEQDDNGSGRSAGSPETGP